MGNRELPPNIEEISIYRNEIEGTEYNWENQFIHYDDLIHTRREYVVHARGFTLDKDVWFDQYAVRQGHSRFWYDIISDNYENAEEWDDVSDNSLYWSLTGSGSFVLQHPKIENMNQEHTRNLVSFLMNEWDFNENDHISLITKEGEHYKIKLKNLIKKD